jgi:hypothetical protein
VPADRFYVVGCEPDRLVGYGSRVVAGLIACAVVAATLHADVAALTILAAVTLVTLAVASLMRRDGLL